MEAKTSSKLINILISYHRHDIKWRDRIDKALMPYKENGQISTYEGEVNEQNQEIDPNSQKLLATYDLIILFISKNYLSLKDLIEKEIPDKIIPIQKRGIRVIPVYCEHCEWQAIAWLREMKLWPNNSTALADMLGNEPELEKYISKLAQEISGKTIQLSGNNAGAHVSTYTEIVGGSGEISINVDQNNDVTRYKQFHDVFINFIKSSHGWPKEDIDDPEAEKIKTLQAVRVYIRDPKSKIAHIIAILSYHKSMDILKRYDEFSRGTLKIAKSKYLKRYIIFPALPNSEEPFEIYHVPVEGEAVKITSKDFPYFEEQKNEDNKNINEILENKIINNSEEVKKQYEILRDNLFGYLKEKGWPETAFIWEGSEKKHIADIVLCHPESKTELAIFDIKLIYNQNAIHNTANQIRKYITSINKDLLGYIILPVQSNQANESFEIYEVPLDEELIRVELEDFPAYNEVLFTMPLNGAGKRLYRRLVELARNKHGYEVNAVCKDYINLQIKKNHRSAAQIHRQNETNNLALVLAGYQKAFPDLSSELFMSRGEITQISGYSKKYPKEMAWLEGKVNHRRLKYRAGAYIIKPGSLVLDEIEKEVGELLQLAKKNAEDLPEENRERKETSSDVVHGHIADQATKDDKLGYEYYVEGMTEFLTSERTEAPLAISIEGPWGSGKSSFMMMLREKLIKQGKPTVWFNAWRHDKAEAMCATFALVFLEQMNKSPIKSLLQGLWFLVTFRLTESKPHWSNLCRSLFGRINLFRYRFHWSDGWLDMLRWLCVWTVFAVVGILGIYLGWRTGYTFFDKLITRWTVLGETIKKIFTDSELFRIIGGTGGLAGVVTVLITLFRKMNKWIGNPLEINLKKYVAHPDYEGHVQFIEKFHNDFEKIVKAYAGNKKVYVFIDDIDRCMVPKSADLMQALNMLICNNPNLIFIVGMDREKVAAGLAVKFEKLLPYLSSIPVEIDKDDKYIVPPKEAKKFGYDFIEKFIQLPFTLPKPNKTMIRDYVQQLCGNSKSKENVFQVAKATPQKAVPAAAPDLGQLNPLKNLNIIEENTLDADKRRPGSGNMDINVGLEDVKKREEVRERVDTDHVLLCRVGEIVTKALEYNPRRIKQFINLYRLRTYLAAGRNLIELDGESINYTDWTLERLAKFVAIELRWPMFLADVMIDRDLLKGMQAYALDNSVVKPGKWADDKSLLEFLKAKPENEKDIDFWDMSEVDIESLMEVSGAVSKLPDTGTNPE